MLFSISTWISLQSKQHKNGCAVSVRILFVYIFRNSGILTINGSLSIMQSSSRCPSLIFKRITSLLNKSSCDKLEHPLRCPGATYRQCRFQHKSSALTSPKSLVNLFNDRLDWLNSHYDRITGVSELRQIHVKIIEAESRYKDTTKKRKSCQDQIDDLSGKVQAVRDKLDTTNRSSDSYLRLITTEHQLLKERTSLELDLAHLKNEEQSSFDNMSEHLRHNFTLERLRQERARYMNIITLCLSVVGSMVALISQKRRDQKRLDSIFVQYNDKLEDISFQLTELSAENHRKLESIRHQLDEITRADDDKSLVRPRTKVSNSNGWLSYLPGLNYLTHLCSYFF